VTGNEEEWVEVNNFSGEYKQKDNSHGDIRVMSVLEPLPGRLGSGLTNVVSMVVQCSPLRRQFPIDVMSRRDCHRKVEVRTGLQVRDY